MSTAPEQFADDDRLLTTLQRLLTIDAPELHAALNQASTLICEALGADKSDVFLYDAASTSLVALGTSDTPMGHRQHELGLDRMPLANGGPPVTVFQTGEPYLTGHADQDPDQPRGVIDGLGVRSQLDVPLTVNQRAPRGPGCGLRRTRALLHTGPALPRGALPAGSGW